MKLPNALTPWAAQLKIFPDEISLAIGTMARKIAPFIAPLQSHEEIADRDPNGYDGVTRRGIYERLLISELALTDEMSEEFIRRAVMGEHLFLNLARIAPSADRISVALFNAGAEQLGTPRIAHLAALIVLARRAAAAKAAFMWGILQDGNLTTFSEVSEIDVMRLINARTTQNLEAEHLAGWSEKLRELDSAADVWLIGGDELKNFDESKRFSRLHIKDVLEPNVSQLQISVKSSSGIEKQTTLELPEEAICTRLLRNPFEVHKKPEKVDLPGILSSFIFDDHGGKIFVRGDSRNLLYISIPNSPKASTGETRRYRLAHGNEILLAAGRLGKSVATVSLTESGQLRLDYPKFGNFRLPIGKYSIKKAEFILPGDEETLLPVYNLHYPHSTSYMAAILDAKNNLFVLQKGDNEEKGYAAAALDPDKDTFFFHKEKESDKNCAGEAILTATEVLAAARLLDKFVYVGRETSTKKLQIISYSEKIEKRDLPFDQVTKAFFGRSIYLANKTFGLIALGNAEDNFAIISQSGDKYIQANVNSKVVGVFHDPGFSAEIGLVELEEDRRTLNFNVGRKYVKQIMISDEEIEKITFSHRSPVFAYKTASGKVVVFSLTHRVPIRIIGREKPL